MSTFRDKVFERAISLTGWREKVAISSNFFAKIERDNCRVDTLAVAACQVVCKKLDICVNFSAKVEQDGE